MERFDSIYPFTTENIAGYMNDLDLTDKKVITVTGSSDHIINAILKGATRITTFDINPLTKLYMDLKLSAIEQLSFEDFLEIFLYNTDKSLKSEIIKSLEMTDDSKKFWIRQLLMYNNNGLDLKRSELFNIKYFNPSSKLWQNMYLDEKNYEIVKEKIRKVKITFINQSLKDLVLDDCYDYMFLSNISDYISTMYDTDGIIKYKKLIDNFLINVKQIYFAYLYDIGNKKTRSNIDNLDLVNKLFKNIEVKQFRSALETKEEKKDGVLILRRK